MDTAGTYGNGEYRAKIVVVNDTINRFLVSVSGFWHNLMISNSSGSDALDMV